jgi:signal transduction histidine kinase
VSREREGLEFYSALAASVTHELNNVLSIIDQAAGLLGDLVAGAGAGRDIDPQRLKTTQERINRQVRKGVEIVRRFNRFAHSPDDHEGSFDLCGETDNLVTLARRFADLKKVRIECRLLEGEIQVAGDAFALQQAVFVCLQMILKGSEEGDRIEISARRGRAAAMISVAGTADCAIDKTDARFEQLARLMKGFNGNYELKQGELGGTALELLVRGTPAV